MDDILFGRDESAYHKAFSLNKAMLHMLLQEDATNKIEVTAWLQAMPIELHNFQGMLEQYLLSQTSITMVRRILENIRARVRHSLAQASDTALYSMCTPPPDLCPNRSFPEA
jgi:hypothetical protein